jgi:hypothetical protein
VRVSMLARACTRVLNIKSQEVDSGERESGDRERDVEHAAGQRARRLDTYIIAPQHPHSSHMGPQGFHYNIIMRD